MSEAAAPVAVVLVGGEGTRLRPLTWTTPKQLLPVAGVPLLRRVLEPLERVGVERVVLSLGYRSSAFDELDLGPLETVRVTEDSPLGSGGGLAHAVRAAGVEGTFLALNGDVVGDVDVAELLARHEQSGARATILVKEVDDPSEFGVAVVEPGGLVRGFIEKPPPPAPSNLINAGVWVLQSSILDSVPQGAAASIERDIFPGLAAAGQMQAVTHRGWWFDVGRLDRYLAANAALTRQGSTPAGWLQDSHANLLGPGAVVDPSARVTGTVAGPASVIGAGAVVSGSVLLDRASVGAEAVVERCVLGAGWSVGDAESVKDCILAEGAG